MTSIRSGPVPVLVLNFADNYWQHGALGIARSLGRMGVPVHFIQEDPRAPAAMSRYVVSKFEAALFSSTRERAAASLVQAGRRLGDCVLIPTDDVGVSLIAEHSELFEQHFRFARQSPDLVRSLSNKRGMFELCRKEGIDTPATIFPNSPEEAAEAGRTLGFPCVMKGIDASVAHACGHGGGVTIVSSPDELLSTFEEMACPGDPNVLVQEHVPGDPRDVWMFNGYFDEKSRCLFAQTGRKLRQHPPYTGMTTLGECATNDLVRNLTIEVMERIGYRGPLDLGLRYDHRDDSYKLLDVNPRMGGTFRLFVDESGMDTVRATYLDLTGQPVESSAARPGRTWVVENFDLSSSRQYVKDGRLTIRQWMTSFARADERAWFASDDLRPFLRMCRKFFVHSPVEVARRRGRAAPQTDAASGDRQGVVDDFFDEQGSFWGAVYEDPGVEGDVYRRRRDLVLDWAHDLRSKAGSTLLDLGCGTGVTAIPLARAGWEVEAIDPSESMVREATARAEHAGVGDALTVRRGDAHELDHPDASFDAVVAVGVLPWLHSPARALAEVNRVLRPGGSLIVTSDNRARATKLLNPMFNPLLAPFRRIAKSILTRFGLVHEDPNAVWPRMYYGRELRLLLADAGLVIERTRTIGFGPFTLFGRPVGRHGGRSLDRRLQAMADAGRPLVRSLGAHDVVLARKP